MSYVFYFTIWESDFNIHILDFNICVRMLRLNIIFNVQVIHKSLDDDLVRYHIHCASFFLCTYN